MIYTRIKEMCEKKRISIYRLEKDLNFPASTIVKWKESSPTVEKIKKVSNFKTGGVDYGKIFSNAN